MLTDRLPDVTTHADFVRLFHDFDAKRYHWLAEQLREAGRERIAELAESWASEHELTAAKLAEVAA